MITGSITLRPECRFSALVIALFVVVPVTDALAAPNQEKAPTKIIVAEGSAKPGEEVVLPLSLSTAEGTEIGSLELSLEFPKALLSFVKIDLGGLATAVDAHLETEVKEGATGEYSVLRARISTIADGRRRSPISPGPVAYVVFSIDMSASPGTEIALTPKATALTNDDPPRPLVALAVENTQIIVSDPAIIACLFYMH